MRTTTWLIVRQHRFGFAMLAASATAFVIGALFLVWLHFGPAADCRAASLQPNLTDQQLFDIAARCEQYALPVQLGADFIGLTGVGLPLIAALLLAAPLIAVELELGTATLAWSLARTRRSWLLPRMALVVVLTVGLGVAGGLLTDWLTADLLIRGSPWESLSNYDSQGAMIAARTFLVAAAGLFGGALLGRQMPALVVAGALAAAIGMGITIENQGINRANMVVLANDPSTGMYGESDLYIENRVQVIATGEILTWDQLPMNSDPSSPEYQATYRDVSLGIPASQAGAVVWRNVAFYTGPGVVLLLLTLVIVERRRPYLS